MRHVRYTNLAAGPLAAGGRPAAFICWCVGASISELRFLPPPDIVCRANAMAEAVHPQGSLSSSGNFGMYGGRRACVCCGQALCW